MSSYQYKLYFWVPRTIQTQFSTTTHTATGHYLLFLLFGKDFNLLKSFPYNWGVARIRIRISFSQLAPIEPIPLQYSSHVIPHYSSSLCWTVTRSTVVAVLSLVCNYIDTSYTLRDRTHLHIRDADFHGDFGTSLNLVLTYGIIIQCSVQINNTNNKENILLGLAALNLRHSATNLSTILY